MYNSVAKGTSRAEVTLNSEKIKPVALAVVESKGIGKQAVSPKKLSDRPETLSKSCYEIKLFNGIFY